MGLDLRLLLSQSPEIPDVEADEEIHRPAIYLEIIFRDSGCWADAGVFVA